MAILKGALDFLRNRNSIESPTSVDTATTDSKGFIDIYKCEECGEIENLEVHHIISINKCGDKFDTDNLITLCHSCHNAQHNRF